jgi:hypothetical protein
MSKWFFYLHDKRIYMQCRAEGRGVVGDAFKEIAPGGKLLNLSYSDLAKAGAGVVLIEGGKAQIAA